MIQKQNFGVPLPMTHHPSAFSPTTPMIIMLMNNNCSKEYDSLKYRMSISTVPTSATPNHTANAVDKAIVLVAAEKKTTFPKPNIM